MSLNNLAALYRDQGRYSEAEPLHKRALSIQEQVLGPTHPNTAKSLNNVAALYREQGRYSSGAISTNAALSIQEQVLGTRLIPEIRQRV